LTDRYTSYADLCRNHRENEDYRIVRRPGALPVLILAPHGGEIEPFTSELADLIAGDDFGYYSLVGEMRRHNFECLHITSHRFDEPLALEALAGADVVLAIHGARGDHAFVMIGGLDARLTAALERSLLAAGFTVEPPAAGLAGRHPRNICNRGRRRVGAQLELSAALRRELRRDPTIRTRFVEAVRSAIFEVLESERDGLPFPEGAMSVAAAIGSRADRLDME
jgi:phage replication-related protein YjqB (UPF0714/DUF867 family)